MNKIKTALTVYFVFYGVTSFINNVAHQFLQQQEATRIRMEEQSRLSHPTSKHGGYM